MTLLSSFKTKSLSETHRRKKYNEKSISNNNKNSSSNEIKIHTHKLGKGIHSYNVKT